MIVKVLPAASVPLITHLATAAVSPKCVSVIPNVSASATENIFLILSLEVNPVGNVPPLG